MAFLRQCRVANARVTRTVLLLHVALDGIENPMTVLVINHVVKILDALLARKIAEDVHVAVGLRVGGENVMVRDDDNFLFVPDFRGLTEFAFEHADGARSANVVRHEHVGIHPNVVAGLNRSFAGGARENFFRQRHKADSIADAWG